MMAWTIRKKLIFTNGLLMAVLIAVGGVEYFNIAEMTGNADEFIKVQMPAVRNMTLADMMHDGLRATAYRAIITSEGNDATQKKAVYEEYKEMSENISKYLAVLDKLPLKAATKQAIAQAQPEVEAYVKATEEIVGLALAGQHDRALARMPAFQEAFEKLEGDLGKLGELIEKNADARSDESLALGRRATYLGLLAIGLGLALALGMATWLIRNLNTSLRHITLRLRGESEHVTSNAEQVSQASGGVSASSQEQSRALQESAASIEEISAMIRKTSESSQLLEQAASRSEQAATKGREFIGRMQSAMESIRDSNNQILKHVEDSNARIGGIVSVIGEIGDKTKVINDIVFQTKLLSFNASVEAARAGEHGKGFAVVAEEVGNLAQMSGNAAKEISGMLSSSIERVESIVNDTKLKIDGLVSEGRSNVGAGLQIAVQCGQSLEEIVGQVNTVNALISEITTAIGEQTTGVTEISRSVTKLDQAMHQNVDISRQSSQAAGALLSRADELRGIVGELETMTTGERQAA